MNVRLNPAWIPHRRRLANHRYRAVARPRGHRRSIPGFCPDFARSESVMSAKPSDD
jgi:hypothetical protein